MCDYYYPEDSQMKKFEHSVFHIFSTVPIKHRLLITYLFLSSFILVITAVSFYKDLQKCFSGTRDFVQPAAAYYYHQ